jgi:hypothetical protein
VNLFKKSEEPEGPDESERGDELLDQEHGDDVVETERQASARELRAALRDARVRLGQGSVWLWQWHAASLRKWCAGGRRSDLDGLSAEVGVWVRGGVLAAVGYGGWRLIEARPAVLWVLGGVWVLAACHAEHPAIRTAKRKARAEAKQREAETETGVEADEQGLDQDAEPDADQDDDEPPVLALIRSEIGADSGVHLRDLYPAMRASLPGCSKASDEVLRAVLDEHRIPVRRSIRARGVAGRSGVHRSDLFPLPSPEGPPGGLSAPLSTHGDAGQAASGERRGEQRRAAGRAPESAAGASVLVQDPDNPVRWHVRRAS